jgi:geranylgeranyl pyrophosphate synthase/predicted secreted hydrolase
MDSDLASASDLYRIEWPAPGAIDLDRHDRPHPSASMEWWYVNTHITTADARSFSLFAAFFRVDNTEDKTPERQDAHFLTWALVDVDGRRYLPETLLDPTTPRTALRELDAGRGPGDDRLARALREVFEKGAVGLPDALLREPARVAATRLDLDYDGNRFIKNVAGIYHLDLTNRARTIGCRLRIALAKPVIRHGDEGVVRGLSGQEMFYYFSPRCSVEGQLLIDGAWVDVQAGSAWYDHEFGEHRESGDSHQSSVGWNWLAAQLDNGYDISAYELIDKKDPLRSHGRWLILSDPAGRRTAYDRFELEALEWWTSTKTFNEYPTAYRLTVTEAGLTLEVHAALAAQEVVTIISPPAFWEGRVTVRGMMNDAAVAGIGFVERSGLSVVDTTDEFFASVGRETRRAIDALLPASPSAEQAVPLIGSPSRRHFLDGVDLDQYSRIVLQPIREIILRGGKAWRSYGILSCIDLVGGDSQRFAHWLALPELLHVGSLIIDDVQDDSDVRRGGPACHKMFGTPLAINAGCASYFLAQIPLIASGLGDSLLARIYEAYFEAVRAAHAGQALDIDGLSRMMPSVVEHGDGALLEQRVLATHRLKSAAPPGALARMSALIGGGTVAQSDALGNLFEAYGLAFQIIDDVLNLRGFEENRKSHGEDITQGKVTAPIAKAMTRLPLDQRRELWSRLSARPSDPTDIRDVIAIVSGCGALDACERQARELVEREWQALDPLIPDSQYKVRLRAFGWFVLDRHY